MGTGTGTQAQGAEYSYLWTTTAEIQGYLDAESIITIGVSGTYTEADAMTLENGVVNDIVSYLSPFFILTAETVSPLLADIAAKLTAAQIGLARMGSSMGSQPADWTYRLMNQGWAALQRIAISQSLPGVTAKTVSLENRLIMSKIRERSLIASV
jgi:hypothetical protein